MMLQKIFMVQNVYVSLNLITTPIAHGSYGQMKSGKNQKKSGNFTFQSQGKMRWSEKVRENQSTRVQKITKMQKKILNCFTQTAYNSSNFFSCSLCSEIICIFTFKFVLLHLLLVRLQAISLE